jgi:hypothetical protein
MVFALSFHPKHAAGQAFYAALAMILFLLQNLAPINVE